MVPAANNADFGGNADIFASCDRSPYQSFVVPKSIVVCCIHEGNDVIERCVNGPHALLSIDWAIESGHPHTAESQAGYFKCTEFLQFHGLSFCARILYARPI